MKPTTGEWIHVTATAERLLFIGSVENKRIEPRTIRHGHAAHGRAPAVRLIYRLRRSHHDNAKDARDDHQEKRIGAVTSTAERIVGPGTISGR